MLIITLEKLYSVQVTIWNLKNCCCHDSDHKLVKKADAGTMNVYVPLFTACLMHSNNALL